MVRTGVSSWMEAGDAEGYCEGRIVEMCTATELKGCNGGHCLPASWWFGDAHACISRWRMDLGWRGALLVVIRRRLDPLFIREEYERQEPRA